MTSLRTLLVALLALGVVGCLAAPSRPDGLAASGRVYREWRALADTEAAAGRRWQSDVHRAMVRLGETLGDGRHTRREVEEIMGPPDAVLASGNDDSTVRHREATRATLSPGETHRVYFWRGWHDYLYYVCRGDTVTAARWYNAWE